MCLVANSGFERTLAGRLEIKYYHKLLNMSRYTILAKVNIGIRIVSEALNRMPGTLGDVIKRESVDEVVPNQIKAEFENYVRLLHF